MASLALPAALAALAACTGNTSHDQTTNSVAVTGDSGPDSAGPDVVAARDSGPDPAASDSATSSAIVGDAEMDACADIEPSPAELTCASDQDCALVVTGAVCPGYVPTIGSKVGTLCEKGVANSAGVARIAAQIAAIPHGDDAGFDFCDTIVGSPRCLQGQCTVCGPVGPGSPACSDAGVLTTVDGSSP